MTNVSRLQQIGEDREVPMPPPAVAAQQQATAANLIMLALKALSQRALTALAALTTLAYIGSVWYLIWSVLPNPTPMQLGAIALYAASVSVIRRW